MQKAEWVDLAQRKVIAMRERHSTDRIKLELLLETTPRDSRYSSALIELMRKEEISGKDHLSPTAQIISSKVDEALQFETKAFFAKISSHNIRKWNVFKEKMTMERDALKAELTGSSEAVTSENDSCEFPCIDELALEEMRLDEDYNRNWLKYENFNLQEAFKSQAAKVESDWQVHESSLVDDYRKRKDRIMGTIRKSSTASNVSGEVQDQRWQHPEKQKTLIHTAPVLSPSRQEIKSGKGKKDANTLMEVCILFPNILPFHLSIFCLMLNSWIALTGNTTMPKGC